MPSELQKKGSTAPDASPPSRSAHTSLKMTGHRVHLLAGRPVLSVETDNLLCGWPIGIFDVIYGLPSNYVLQENTHIRPTPLGKVLPLWEAECSLLCEHRPASPANTGDQGPCLCAQRLFEEEPRLSFWTALWSRGPGAPRPSFQSRVCCARNSVTFPLTVHLEERRCYHGPDGFPGKRKREVTTRTLCIKWKHIVESL